MKNVSIRQTFFILLFCVALFLLSPAISQSDSDLPSQNLSYPVLLMSTAVSGSGFFYNTENATYLITARHVLFKETTLRVPNQFEAPTSLRHKFFCGEDKEKKEFILTFSGVMSEDDRDELMKAAPKSDKYDFKEAIEKLYKESQTLKLRTDEMTLFSNVEKRFGEGINEIQLQLAKLYKNGKIKYHPSHDVAYINIGVLKNIPEQVQHVVLSEGVIRIRGEGIMGVPKDGFKLLKDVIVGNPVFVFGYPTSITSIDPWLDIKLPLLRKGIVAGKNDILKAIILDCPVFQGNSGGLVLEVEKSFTETKYKAIGVITNLVPYQITWLQNSGYSIVVPMDFVEELIASEK